jgi:hypothetical protein
MADTPEGAALTRAHRAAQTQVAQDTAQLVRASWPLLDLRDIDGSRMRWVRTVTPVVVDGRLTSIRTSAAYLRSFSLAELGSPMGVIEDVIDDAVRAAISTSLDVTGPVTVKALTGSGFAVEHAGATALESVTGSVVRHVLDGGRTTVERSVEREPRFVGWRRVGVGANCRFCNMLIGRGEVYSAGTVRFASHDHCNCGAEPASGGPPASALQYSASARVQTPADRERVRVALGGDAAPAIPEADLAAARVAQARAELPVLERSLADLERRAVSGMDLSGPIEWQRARIEALRAAA